MTDPTKAQYIQDILNADSLEDKAELVSKISSHAAGIAGIISAEAGGECSESLNIYLNDIATNFRNGFNYYKKKTGGK